jgi:hypothetical protein
MHANSGIHSGHHVAGNTGHVRLYAQQDIWVGKINASGEQRHAQSGSVISVLADQGRIYDAVYMQTLNERIDTARSLADGAVDVAAKEAELALLQADIANRQIVIAQRGQGIAQLQSNIATVQELDNKIIQASQAILTYASQITTKIAAYDSYSSQADAYESSLSSWNWLWHLPQYWYYQQLADQALRDKLALEEAKAIVETQLAAYEAARGHYERDINTYQEALEALTGVQEDEQAMLSLWQSEAADLISEIARLKATDSQQDIALLTLEQQLLSARQTSGDIAALVAEDGRMQWDETRHMLSFSNDGTTTRFYFTSGWLYKKEAAVDETVFYATRHYERAADVSQPGKEIHKYFHYDQAQQLTGINVKQVGDQPEQITVTTDMTDLSWLWMAAQDVTWRGWFNNTWLDSLQPGLSHIELLGLFHNEWQGLFHPQWLGLLHAEILLFLPDSLYLPSTLDVYRVGLDGLPAMIDS